MSGSYRVAPIFLIRMAGVPFEVLDPLGTPETAAAARELLVRRKELPEQNWRWNGFFGSAIMDSPPSRIAHCAWRFERAVFRRSAETHPPEAATYSPPRTDVAARNRNSRRHWNANSVRRACSLGIDPKGLGALPYIWWRRRSGSAVSKQIVHSRMQVASTQKEDRARRAASASLPAASLREKRYVK